MSISQYLMYLRKSRQDDPNETVAEVLSKHETILQEHAARALGGLIPEENIYREIGSGESIADRAEIKKLLARIEDPNIKGVLVVEPSRLSRGDFNDCGTLMQTFLYTNTLIATPMMSYDLNKKMERKFFQGELLRGNDYLEYTKEILWRGRVAAVKRGHYIGSQAPYGYDKVRYGKVSTLVPNEKAEIVRLMFRWSGEEHLTAGAIARRLDDMNTPPIRSAKWDHTAVRRILTNPTYLGKVRWNNIKETKVLEDGKIVTRLHKQDAEDVILSDGLHEAIIDQVSFDAAQRQLTSNPHPVYETGLINPLASVLRCSVCGRSMGLQMRRTQRGGKIPHYRCTKDCHKIMYASDVMVGVIAALEQSELPSLRTKLADHKVDELAAHKSLIAKLEKQMEEYRQQEEMQFDLLETGRYTPEQFDHRNAILHEKMTDCEQKIKHAHACMPKSINYQERVASLEKAIEALKDESVSNESKNKLLRAVVDHIDYSTDGAKLKERTLYLNVFLKL